MTTILILFIAASLTFYVLFAGADFGAGILEFFSRGRFAREQSVIVTKAIGPVWEANHVWLILLVVILFMGFPDVYVIGSTFLHLPAVAVLLGIVFRGCAFTFRHYDAKSEEGYGWYTRFFSWSSLWTALWLGILAASLHRGRMTQSPRDFYEGYVAPWWGAYPFSVGIFTASLFAFLASVYLIGETSKEEIKMHLRQRALLSNLAMLLAGAFVFVTSYREGIDLLGELLGHPLSLWAFVASAAAFIPLWASLFGKGERYSRIIAGFQVVMVLLGWYTLNSMHVFVFKGGETLDFYTAAAPASVQKQLLLALLVGTVLILPSLYFLMRVFKGKRFWLS